MSRTEPNYSVINVLTYCPYKRMIAAIAEMITN